MRRLSRILTKILQAAAVAAVLAGPMAAEDVAQAPPLGAVPTRPAAQALARQQKTIPPVVYDYMALGLIDEKTGDQPAAFRRYLAALQAAPQSNYVRESVGRVGERIHEDKDQERRRRRAVYVQKAQQRDQRAALEKSEVSSRMDDARRFLARGRLLEASDAFNRILADEPKNLAAAGEIQKIRKLLKARIERTNFSSRQQHLAHVGIYWYNSGRWQEAAQSLDAALAAGPLEDELAAARLGDYAAVARDRWQQSLWEVEKNEMMKTVLADYAAGNFERAEAALREMTDKDPSDPKLRHYLDEVGKKLEQQKEARRAGELKEAVSARFQDGVTHFGAGRYSEAMEDFARVLQLDSEHVQAQEWLKRAQTKARQTGFPVPEIPVEDQAERKYREGLRDYGNEDYAAAAAAFRDALRFNPGHSGAQQALTQIPVGKEKR